MKLKEINNIIDKLFIKKEPSIQTKDLIFRLDITELFEIINNREKFSNISYTNPNDYVKYTYKGVTVSIVLINNTNMDLYKICSKK